MAASPEQRKQYQVVKSFKALNTKSNRTAIADEEFSWLENVQPIGFGNLKVINAPSNVTSGNSAVTFGNTITSFSQVNINNTNYVLGFESDGRAEYVKISDGSKGNLAVAGTFSGDGVRVRQWKDERAIISDPDKGYFTWDGTDLIKVGSISTIGITNPGSGYTTVPQVTISAPNQTNGVQATAVASISNAAGTVISINMTNIGSAYNSVPTVTISAPTSSFGTPAEAVATISGGNVVAITVTNPGSGYSSAPTVTITGGGGTNATANAVLGSGIVSAITITQPGTGYTAPPTITISGGGGNNATATSGFLTFATGSIGIVLNKGGTGYTAANTTVTIGAAPVGGTNATATAIVNGGVITQIVVNNPGAGYTSAPTVTITGSGSNANATAVLTDKQTVDIASFQGRVWLAQGRTVFYTAAGSYNDFSTISAGNIELTDDTLHTNITGLISANNFLYVFGEDSINVFSDVRVSAAGLTQFTNTNVSASVGSKRINAIYPYFRSLLFMNDYGIYALVGATTTKLSDALDGIFPLIDFNYPVSGGQVLLNNILCAAFNFYYNDPDAGLRPLQAVFFDKKWFLTSQGTLKYVTSLATAGGLYLYGTDGTNLTKLYSSTTADIDAMVQTALWPLTDVIRDKQALKLGVEATLTKGGILSLTVDSEYGSSPVYTLGNYISWYNNLGTTIGWVNNSSATVQWIGGQGYQLYKSDAQQYGKYLGYTINSTAPGITYNTFEMEYELRARF